jgi:hypothetical protein
METIMKGPRIISAGGCLAALVVGGCSGGGVSPDSATNVPVTAPYGANRVGPDAIIYTPADVDIQDSQYNLDLDSDGRPDFSLKQVTHSGGGCDDYNTRATFSTTTLRSSNVQGSSGLVAALPYGSPIGLSQSFLSGEVLVDRYRLRWRRGTAGGYGVCVPYSRNWGQWLGRTAYMGLAFAIRGRTHYGWAQLSVAGDAGQAHLYGYAYQTKADKPIMAGQK